MVTYSFSISFNCHISDDFLIFEPPASTIPFDSLWQARLSSMLLAFLQKILISPSQRLKLRVLAKSFSSWGSFWIRKKMEARLPADKVERIKTALSAFQSKHSTTLQELRSLIGTLNFACEVIPPGRPFLQRTIGLTRCQRNLITTLRLPLVFTRILKCGACLLSSGMG